MDLRDRGAISVARGGGVNLSVRRKEHYQVDLLPHGAYYGSATEQFGTQECWPIPLVGEPAG
jgi:hypothetical protein